MRKIPCEFCNGGAIYLIFDSIRICHHCKMQVIQWLRDSEVGLGGPFAKEFLLMERARPSDSQKKFSQGH